MLVSLLLGLVPIIWLVIALTGLKMPGYKACGIAIAFAAVVAIPYKGMAPFNCGTAILEGVLSALWPIILVIIAALFTYNLVLETGAMDRIKAMLSGISSDKRILAIIIGWSFGCFMEGMAGFGTAVAIPASILIALGFEPLPTLVGLLIVNSTPTAFGSVGVPTTTLASLLANRLEMDASTLALSLSANTALIEALLMFLSPFFMVFVIGKGFKAFRGILPIVLVSSLAFTVPNFLVATFIGPELPDIIGSGCSMAITIPLAIAMRNKPVPEEYRIAAGKQQKLSISVAEGVKAWSPFILIFVLLLGTSKLVPFINAPLSTIKSSFQIYAGPVEKPTLTTFSWINTPGVWIIIAAVIGGLIQGASPQKIASVFGHTVASNVKTIVTICSVLATAKIMVYSGMTTDVAVALVAITGGIFPLFSPLVGVLGAFVTGSGTNTGVLFGPLQQETANQIYVLPGKHILAEWLCAANAMGAGIGKMIAPSNVALACAAAGIVGQESKVIRAVFKYTLIYTIIGGIICFALANAVTLAHVVP